MNTLHENGSALRIALGLACFIIIVAGMKAAATIIVPFLLSAFIAIICAPIINSLQNRGMPMWLALATVVALIGILLLLHVQLGRAAFCADADGHRGQADRGHHDPDHQRHRSGLGPVGSQWDPHHRSGRPSHLVRAQPPRQGLRVGACIMERRKTS